MRHAFLTVCLTALLVLTGRPAAASPFAFNVFVNTAPLIGNPAGPFYLDFQLNGTGANTAVISAFNFGGGAPVGGTTTFGTATGSLGSTVTLRDESNFYNEFFQQFTPGSTLSFSVLLTTNVVAPTPDAFSFAILDGSAFNIPTTGLGDSLALVSITSATPGVTDVHTSRGLNLPGGPAYSGIVAQALAVPEPGTMTLVALGLAGLGARRRHRRSTR